MISTTGSRELSILEVKRFRILGLSGSFGVFRREVESRLQTSLKTNTALGQNL